jgi:hypothetical protein
MSKRSVVQIMTSVYLNVQSLLDHVKVLFSGNSSIYLQLHDLPPHQCPLGRREVNIYHRVSPTTARSTAELGSYHEAHPSPPAQSSSPISEAPSENCHPSVELLSRIHQLHLLQPLTALPIPYCNERDALHSQKEYACALRAGGFYMRLHTP